MNPLRHLGIAAVLWTCGSLQLALAQLPSQPLDILPGEPNLVHDDHYVDSYWGLKSKTQTVTRVFHPLTKHPASPFGPFAEDKPSYLTIAADQDAEGKPLYRMYYQANFRIPDDREKGPFYHTEICYAESADGITWTKPDLNLFPDRSAWAQPNNVVISLPDRPTLECNGPCLLETVREGDRKDYRHILLYRMGGRGNGDVAGIHIAGTNDGIHFDMANSQHVAHLHSDTSNSICYNPVYEQYQLFCRAKNMYLRFRGDRLDTGASRRVATMFSPELWTDWLEQVSRRRSSRRTRSMRKRATSTSTACPWSIAMVSSGVVCNAFA